MKMVLCLIGLLFIFFASLLWVASSPSSIYYLSLGEFLTLFTVGALLVAPQVISQAHQFLTSGSSDQVPF
ncbi:hypothetical protein ACFQUU_27300 [Herbaspirillum sp. GCM10030257]|uniref:hypothetical protein n=1 Tax=Herbaspirillum sp. GCM10030257 TaxID=3273393 RepID=UPI00360C2ADF